MNLEDDFTDVIAKAMRGLGIDAPSLSEASGVSAGDIEALRGGEMNEIAARAISPALGLDAEALIALPGYLPEAVEIPGVRRIELPFGKWRVNAWEIEHGGIRILFDAGTGKRDILGKVSPQGLEALLITHSHPDHIGGVAALTAEGIKVISETDAIAAGKLTFGSLELETVDLSGHCIPATGYFIHGLNRQLFVVGDAIFAGSMGACRTREAHELAGRTLRTAVNKSEPNCIILPGHGPATTFASELLSNPFKARFAPM